MAIDLVGGFIFKTPRRTDVERDGVISHGLHERLSTVKRDIKFQLDRPNHDHICDALINIFNGSVWCR
jgi:hypothetical protein